MIVELKNIDELLDVCKNIDCSKYIGYKTHNEMCLRPRVSTRNLDTYYVKTDFKADTVNKKVDKVPVKLLSCANVYFNSNRDFRDIK